MPICGFCKKEVVFIKNEANSVKGVKFHPKNVARFKAFVCPHCDAVLGIGGPY